MRLQSSEVPFNVTTTVTSIASCPTSNYNILVACNDKTLALCNTEKNPATLSNAMKINSYPIAMAWQPFSISGQRSNESVLAVGCSNGSVEFFKMNPNGRCWPLVPCFTIQAHGEGEVSSVRWSNDGSSLATSGVDGEVRIWSRTGHLRTKLASFSTTVQCISWGPCNESLAIAHGRSLSIIFIQGRSGSVTWDAQDKDTHGLVLAMDWNHERDLILSAGEDGCFSIFSSDGVAMFSSHTQNYPISSVSWIPGGDCFTVGSFRQLSLYDFCGCLLDQKEFEFGGSVIDLSYSKDALQLFSAFSDGGIIVSKFVGKRAYWRGISAEAQSTNKISFSYATKSEEFPDEIDITGGQIVDFAMGFDHLVVLTTSQCLIYSMGVTEVPITIELKDNFVHGLALGPASFVIFGRTSIKIYSYQGKYLSSPNYQLTGIARIKADHISLGQNTLCLIDVSGKKTVRLFHCETGLSLDNKVGKIRHEANITHIYLSRMSNRAESYLIFIDEKKDMYVRLVDDTWDSETRVDRGSYKLEAQVVSAIWDEKSEMLCALLADSRAILFSFPAAPFVDIDLLNETKQSVNFQFAKEETKGGTLQSFSGDHCAINLRNGALIHVPISKVCSLLHQYALVNNWKECIRLCQFKNISCAWGTLACLAIHHDNLETAEKALMAIGAVDKMEHIREIRKMPQGERKNAELTLYKRKAKEALSILLEARPPLSFDAVVMCIQLFQWEKALTIAQRTNNVSEGSKQEHSEYELSDLVLWYRSQYLQKLSKKEHIDSFMELFKKRGVIHENQFEAMEAALRQMFSPKTI